VLYTVKNRHLIASLPDTLDVPSGKLDEKLEKVVFIVHIED
jgi:hypothetical protein